jgi:hypothetical protein
MRARGGGAADGSGATGGDDGRCRTCGEVGHIAFHCERNVDRIKCTACRNLGHCNRSPLPTFSTRLRPQVPVSNVHASDNAGTTSSSMSSSSSSTAPPRARQIQLELDR